MPTLPRPPFDRTLGRDDDWLPIDFHYGPRFERILRVDSELRELLRDGSYEKVLDLLDRRVWLPASRPARSLVRSYMLLGLGRLQESWEEAQTLDNPEHELLYSLGLAAERQAAEERNEETRAEILDLGLQVLTRALEVKESAYWTLLVKSYLLRRKAELAGEEERKALLDEAERLNERGRAMQPGRALPKG